MKKESKGTVTSKAEVAKEEKVSKEENPAPKAKKAKKDPVAKKTEEIVKEKAEREVLYNYPPSVLEAKTEGEKQRRKKAFRQDMRGKIASLLKKYKSAKASKDKEAIKKARIDIKKMAKENLTESGIAKFELGIFLKKKVEA